MFRKAPPPQLFPIVFSVSRRGKKKICCHTVHLSWCSETWEHNWQQQPLKFRICSFPQTHLWTKEQGLGGFLQGFTGKMGKNSPKNEFSHGCVILMSPSGFGYDIYPLFPSLLGLEKEEDRMFLCCCWVLAYKNAQYLVIYL